VYSILTSRCVLSRFFETEGKVSIPMMKGNLPVNPVLEDLQAEFGNEYDEENPIKRHPR
jgi:hypothetical protein